MLPDPLHPAVVHLPIALAVLLPLSAIVGLVTIHRGAGRAYAWGLPLTLAVLLTGSAWLAIQTGEADEDRVEAVVRESAIHDHEEAAERFLLLGGVVTLMAAVGLAKGTVGSAARLVATVGTLVVLVAGVDVGSKGGELVYVHGAASAFASDAPPPDGGQVPEERH